LATGAGAAARFAASRGQQHGQRDLILHIGVDALLGGDQVEHVAHVGVAAAHHLTSSGTVSP
jgi:hypothetical protein